MLGNSKPIPFNPYGTRRVRRRFPSWLALLLIGIALGVAAVTFVQKRYLPPRLSAAESTQLRNEYAAADAERIRLRAELSDQSAHLRNALADRRTAADQLAANLESDRSLHEDMAALIAALPADPRGGAVQVRAGHFVADGGGLSYDLVLTRDHGSDRALPAVLQFTVAGTTASGAQGNVALKPVSLTIGAQEVARGNLVLPDGFKPRQTTVSVLDRAGGKSLGMRVLLN